MRSPGQRVSVIAVGPNAPVRIEHVLAKGRLAGPGRRTAPVTRICRSVGCIAGVNGAFFDRRSGLPFSGITSAGEMIRSVTSARPHVAIDDGLFFDATTPRVELVVTEPDVFNGGSGFNERENRIVLRGVNRPRGKDGLAVYTPRWGHSTPFSSGRELVLQPLGNGKLRVGSRIEYAPISLRRGGGKIPSDGVVLSGTGQGAKTLEAIWKRVNAGTLEPTLHLDVGPGPETLIGSRPLILRGGEVIAPNSWFSRARHPRTILAAKPDGTILLVVIDGRQRRAKGMSLRQAARFVRALGASEATNLDGGGSSAASVRGRLHSNPAGAERYVSTALVVVPA